MIQFQECAGFGNIADDAGHWRAARGVNEGLQMPTSAAKGAPLDRIYPGAGLFADVWFQDGGLNWDVATSKQFYGKLLNAKLIEGMAIDAIGKPILRTSWSRCVAPGGLREAGVRGAKVSSHFFAVFGRVSRKLQGIAMAEAAV